jgi:hypothetical protein
MKSGIEYMTFLAGWYPKTVQKELVSSKLVEESQEISHMCGSYVVPRYGNAHVPFGVISAKFQILQPVMVRIQEQFLTKKLLKLDMKTPSL